MPFIWSGWTADLDPTDAPQPDFGDETEYEIIISKGYDEAERFGTYGRFGRVAECLHPAKWLNPPHPCPPDTWHAIALWRPELFINLKENDGSS